MLYEDGEITRDFVYVDDVVSRIDDRRAAAGGDREARSTSGAAWRPRCAQRGRGDRRRPPGRARPSRSAGSSGSATSATRVADLTRAAEGLGYRPTVTFAEGVSRLLAWVPARSGRRTGPPRARARDGRATGSFKAGNQRRMIGGGDRQLERPAGSSTAASQAGGAAVRPRLVMVVDNGSTDGSVEHLRRALARRRGARARPEPGRGGGEQRRDPPRARRPAPPPCSCSTTMPRWRPTSSSGSRPRSRRRARRVGRGAQDPLPLGAGAHLVGGRRDVDWWKGLSRDRGTDEPDRGQFDRGEDVDYANTCCLLVRADGVRAGGDDGRSVLHVFRRLGFLRTGWCRAGGRILYVPEAVVLHDVQASSGPQGAAGQALRAVLHHPQPVPVHPAKRARCRRSGRRALIHHRQPADANRAVGDAAATADAAGDLERAGGRVRTAADRIDVRAARG